MSTSPAFPTIVVDHVTLHAIVKRSELPWGVPYAPTVLQHQPSAASDIAQKQEQHTQHRRCVDLSVAYSR